LRSISAAVELCVRRAKTRFDIIFCDPPFPYKFKWELAASIAASPLMGPFSRLLIHRPRQDAFDAPPAGLAFEESRTYGRSVVDFFKRL
jgi:16S rRNA G966 N2-methylase RsmD